MEKTMESVDIKWNISIMWRYQTALLRTLDIHSFKKHLPGASSHLNQGLGLQQQVQDKTREWLGVSGPEEGLEQKHE